MCTARNSSATPSRWRQRWPEVPAHPPRGTQRASRWSARLRDNFPKKSRPLVSAVATAHPHATVELWATDEHRIGLKPLLRRVLAPVGQRPIAMVRHRFAWRYLVGFVHPASGRTLFHLATTVSILLFEVELEVFAHAVGAGHGKQIVLVLDRAGWHTSLRVPEHVHLLFLPPYSPELQPAEHLWPLTNDVLVNRHFVSIEELEDAQLAHCAQLQTPPDRIRLTTRFHWWPQQIHKREDPGGTDITRPSMRLAHLDVYPAGDVLLPELEWRVLVQAHARADRHPPLAYVGLRADGHPQVWQPPRLRLPRSISKLNVPNVFRA